GAADGLEIVDIELKRLVRRERLIVKDIETPRKSLSYRVSAPSHESEPPRQAQNGECPRHCFLGGLRRVGSGGEVWPQRRISWHDAHAMPLNPDPNEAPG